MNVPHHSASSRNRHPRIEPLEARLTLSANFGGYGDFGPPLHNHFNDFGPRAEHGQWSQDSFAGPRDRHEIESGNEFFFPRLATEYDIDRQPIAALWQPSTNRMLVIFTPTSAPISAPPPQVLTEFGALAPDNAGPLKSQVGPPNDALSGPAAAKPQANGPLSLSALELLGSQTEPTGQSVPITNADQTLVESAAVMTVNSTAQLIAAASPGLEVAPVDSSIDEPLSARDEAYANSAETQWLAKTREEAAQVQKLLNANRLTHANETDNSVVETSAQELQPEDYLATDWVNDLVLLAAANSADDAELFLALSGDTPATQSASKLGLSLAGSTPQSEPVVALTETLTPSRTLRWCGAVLAPVLFAAALRDRVKRRNSG